MNKMKKAVIDQILLWIVLFTIFVSFLFWFLDFNCREDPNTSNLVKDSFQALNDAGYTEDNTIFILCSDHGYPDPTTELNEEYFNGIGHDMILTDDNVKVPLIIKVPHASHGVKFEHQVGLVDVLPTIFETLQIKYKNLNTSFQGKSLLSIINNQEEDNRIKRVETRLPMDVKRIGCFRNNDFKYIYLYNDELEYFYDLKKRVSLEFY